MQKQYLQQLDAQDFIPFQANLDTHSIQYQEILRLVPHKRAVFKALLDNNQDIILKVFFSKQSLRHFKREIQNYHLLNQYLIRTPKLIFEKQQGDVYFLAFEYIPHQQEDSFHFENTLKAAQQIIHLHKHHLTHTDCHLSNFIFQEESCHLIDLSSIRKTSSRLARLNNYALFLNQLSSANQEQLDQLIQLYAQENSEKIETIKPYLLNKAKHYHFTANIHFLKKTLRNCTSFVKVKAASFFGLSQRSLFPEWKIFFKNPEAFIADHQLDTLKKGRSSTVFKVKLNNKEYIVKRYNIKNILHFLKRCWRPTRACHSWQYANLLIALDIRTPMPILFYEKRFLGLRSTSYFISEYISGHNLLEMEKNQILTKEAALSACHLLKQLYQQNLYHGDLKATNIITHNNNAYVIDLDSIQLLTTDNKNLLAKDRTRFLQNWKSSDWLTYFSTHLKGQ